MITACVVSVFLTHYCIYSLIFVQIKLIIIIIPKIRNFGDKDTGY